MFLELRGSGAPGAQGSVGRQSGAGRREGVQVGRAEAGTGEARHLLASLAGFGGPVTPGDACLQHEFCSANEGFAFAALRC